MRDMSEYTRVTDVLYPLTGLKFVNPEVLASASERGTKVHEMFTGLMEGIEFMNFDHKVAGYIQSLLQWLPRKFIERPERLFCDKYKITGEIDGIYEEIGGLVLIDIKTSSSESKTWKLQGSAYAYLLKQAGYNIKRIEFVKLSKDGKLPRVYVYEDEFDNFLKCLYVYRTFLEKESAQLGWEHI